MYDIKVIIEKNIQYVEGYLILKINHYVNTFHTLPGTLVIIYFRLSYESFQTRKTDKTELESIQSKSGYYFMYCASKHIYYTI